MQSLLLTVSRQSLRVLPLAALLLGCEASRGEGPATPLDSDAGGDVGLVTCASDSACPGAVAADRCAARQACQAGRCVSLPAVTCSAALAGGVPCRVPVCVAATGACLVGAAPDGAACVVAGCNNATGVCFGGVCAPGAASECDDGDPCTTDACTNNTCTHTPAPDGTACPSDDGCIAGKLCKAGACAGGSPKVCDDGNECTTDECHPPAGCVFTSVPAFQKKPCQDDNPCMGPDYCNGGGRCQSEWYKNAEGQSCVPPDGCALHASCQDGACRASPVAGGGVDALPDGSYCTYALESNGCFADAGTCLQGACQPAAVPNGTECPNCWCSGCATSPGPGRCFNGQCLCE